jgi:hypothetical protein
MINVDNIDRTVHRFQPEALKLSDDRDDSSVLVDRQEGLAERVGFEP